jgi:hypothetical protein
MFALYPDSGLITQEQFEDEMDVILQFINNF